MSDAEQISPVLPPPPLTKAVRGMRKFTVYRINDITGVSGTGVVAEGVEFACKTIAIRWLTPPPDGDVQIKGSLDKFLEIHVHPHPENITIITFEDGEQRIYPKESEIPENLKVVASPSP
jgi:hypothetical protein